MKHYGIIGHPLGHTMSPTLHNWGFEQEKIDANYEAWPTKPEDLATFMTRFRNKGIQGLSVTIPHKQTIMTFVDKLTRRAQNVGAVNTLFWEDDNVLVGDNTDVAGIVNAVRARNLEPESSLVLGAGGAARAAVAACTELGVLALGITNRTRSKAESIASDLGAEVIDWEKRHSLSPELLINCTPLGMSGDLENLSPWETALDPDTTVFDFVYNPLDTLLLKNAATVGCTAIQGIEMFLHQGLEQFRLWTGKKLDGEKARKLLLKELGL